MSKDVSLIHLLFKCYDTFLVEKVNDKILILT